MVFRFLFWLIIACIFPVSVSAVDGVVVNDIDIDQRVHDQANTNSVISAFADEFSGFFFVPGEWGTEGVTSAFVQVSFQIKNFFIILAVVFLIIGVMRLLFSDGSDEDTKKWRDNILWTTVGVFILQIAFSVWKTLLLRQWAQIDAILSWEFWNNILAPIVSLLQFLASFIFIAVMIYAFYLMVTSAGNEENASRGKRVVIYAVIGFLLVRLPNTIVSLIYSWVPQCGNNASGLWIMPWASACTSGDADLEGIVQLFASILKWFNGFLALLCVLLILYAGWLILTSAGDEDKLKQAKKTLVYILIGLIILIASHALFVFLISGG